MFSESTCSGVSKIINLFLRALLGQQVPQHDVNCDSTRPHQTVCYRGVRSVGPVRRAGHALALFKMVRYVLLRPLRPEQNRPARRTGPTDRTPL
jgi:hypothetical protein